MRDVTPSLMGDPQASKRRAPTPTEMHRHGKGRHGHPPTKWESLALGCFRDGLTFSGANAGADWLRHNGRKGSVEHLGDGTYRVTRTV